jgi:hypothetical protein
LNTLAYGQRVTPKSKISGLVFQSSVSSTESAIEKWGRLVAFRTFNLRAFDSFHYDFQKFHLGSTLMSNNNVIENSMPIVTVFQQENLANILNHFQKIKLIATEERIKFSGKFPPHTRYFSNGDRPLVALIKHSGVAILQYGITNNDIIIPDHHLVFFDDSVPHGWFFNQCNLDIYYYSVTDNEKPGPTTGDYCLDNYF